MKLHINPGSNKDICPKCKIPLDIITTYEDSILECEGIIRCPKCNTNLQILIEIKIIIKKV